MNEILSMVSLEVDPLQQDISARAKWHQSSTALALCSKDFEE